MTRTEKKTVFLSVVFCSILGVLSISCITYMGKELYELRERLPGVSEELHSPDNNMTIVEVDGQHLLIVNRHFLCNFTDDAMELDIHRVKAQIAGSQTTINVYKEAGKFLTFLLPPDFKGGAIMVFIENEKGEKTFNKEKKEVHI